ncbi:anti-sigma factor [Pukyongia salina]|uniref:Anti-sigma factor n=1 Tax=Pukyongia salina TaxID=2094025 RepID=A0A2S0HSG6_9FLAO|nr:anti-sigma factor [Pukyongia salina]AVI49649.1 anti-sigma factor [Pukyongia salina]
MSTEEIISSGKLELYVTGSLPAKEAAEIAEAVRKDPVLQKEVEAIETSLIQLAGSVSPGVASTIWSRILNSIRPVRTMEERDTRSVNWAAISGWAAAVLAVGGIFWLLNTNKDLHDEIELTTTENSDLQEQLTETETRLAGSEEILNILRSKDYETILLPGNRDVAPEAFAKVYFDKTNKVAYIDSRGLPEATTTKVYQAWSLKLDPLTPTSMGLLDQANEVEEGIYKFENVPDPDAFGITLEPAGGSESPTLTQLYTLGTVSP